MAGASRTAARGELGAPIRSAPAAKVNAHKTKEIQQKSLHFLGGIGTFQWVTANPNKKISSSNIHNSYQ
jgi:hypothetical protein